MAFASARKVLIWVMRLRLFLVMSLLFCAPAPATVTADSPAESLESLGTATVTGVIDGDTVVLDDGREVRLVGIMAPKLPLGRDWVAEQPFAPDAKAVLEDMVLDRTVEMFSGGQALDRHGRVLAHLVVTGEGLWVQGALLAAGMARVYSFADNRALVADMLALEEQARTQDLGLWSDAFFAVRDAALPASVPVDRFEIVEGVVIDAADVDRRLYLNFGEDWRTDMTVTVSPHNRANFKDGTMELTELEGRSIRVRGWTGWYNGPMIEIDHPEQIEVLD